MFHVVSIITAVAVWMHIALGCCAHHAHGTQGSACHQQIGDQVEVAHAGHDCDTDLRTGESHRPTDRCPTDRCCRSHCAFVTVGKTEFSQHMTVAFLPILTSGGPASLVAVPAHGRVASGGRIEPPLRLHLLNQVLVI